MCAANIILALVAIIIPPLPVCIKRGCCSADMLINVALCALGFIPGLLHSWYIISVTPDFHDYERIVDVEAGSTIRRGNVGTYYVEQPRRANPAPKVQRAAPAANNGVPALRAQAQEGSSSQADLQNDVAPPPYSEGIEGDHKVQKK